MSEEWKPYVEAARDAFVEAAKEFADKEEVQAFFKEQATLYGKEYFWASTASSPQEKKEHEDNLIAIVGQNKSEIARLAIAADDVARAKLEGVLSGVGTLLIKLISGGVGE